MSAADGLEVAAALIPRSIVWPKDMGSTLNSPFMTFELYGNSLGQFRSEAQ